MSCRLGVLPQCLLSSQLKLGGAEWERRWSWACTLNSHLLASLSKQMVGVILSTTEPTAITMGVTAALPHSPPRR